MVSSAYLRLLIFLLAILILACDSSSPAFHIMYSACKLSNQGHNIQPWLYSFPNFEPVCFSMSGSNYCFFTCIQISQGRDRVVWYSHVFENFLQFVVIHTVKALVQSMKQMWVLFCNPLTFSVIQRLLAIWSLIPLPFLNIWKFLVHVLLKPSLMDFEHYLARMWNKCDCMVVGTFLGIVLLVTGMKIDLFQSCGHCWVFQICWHIEFRTLTASSFRTSSSSAGIPSPPLA